MNIENEALAKALSLTQDVTPLLQDCGALCSAACCQDEHDEGLGMWLFPGEEALYQSDVSWADILPSAAYRDGVAVPMLVCDGTCPRDLRPLACRIFPLAPNLRNGNLNLRIDPRSLELCPLASSGIQGLAPAFIEAVEAAFAVLWQDPTQRAFIVWLCEELDSYTELLRKFKKSRRFLR